MSGGASYRLPAKLDLSTAAALAEGLSALRGNALTISAEDVTHVGTPGVQVLLSARKTWDSDGLPLTLAGAPDSFAGQLGNMGLTIEDLAVPAEKAASDGTSKAGETDETGE